MGRIRENIEVMGREYWTLFDPGARNTYVIRDVAARLPTFDITKPESVSLGGKVHQVTRNCWIEGILEDLPIRCHARVLNNIGADDDGKNIEILFGALAMQEWGIRLNLEEEKLDLSHYPKEFVEF